MFALRKFAFLLAALVATSETASAAPVIVDTFNGTTQTVTGAAGGGNPSSAIPSPSTVGGPFFNGFATSRSLADVRSVGTDTFGANINIGVGGALSLQNGSSTGSTVALTYATTGLSLSTGAAFTFEGLSGGGPGGDVPLSVQLFSGATLLATLSVSPTPTGPLSGNFSTNALGANANNITSVVFTVNTTDVPTSLDGTDLTVNALSLNDDRFIIPTPPGVPEPMTLATFGFLTLCGGVAARRKLKAASVAKA